MTMLPNIEEAMEDARNGKLSPYWQNNLKRECLHGELSAEERLALSELNCILSETPQWSSEEALCHDMENIGGRVRFCRFWNEHYSMVQLTEDRNGKYSTAYVLDTETTPDVRKAAALQAQKELADCIQIKIKEIRVRKDYEISITLNASFNQVEQLKAVSTYDGAEIFEEISEKGA